MLYIVYVDSCIFIFYFIWKSGILFWVQRTTTPPPPQKKLFRFFVQIHLLESSI